MNYSFHFEQIYLIHSFKISMAAYVEKSIPNDRLPLEWPILVQYVAQVIVREDDEKAQRWCTGDSFIEIHF